MTRRRGRPHIDDSQHLARVADLVARGEANTPRRAIVRVVGPSDSAVRRLQRKWRASKHQLLARAQERIEAHAAARVVRTVGGLVGPFAELQRTQDLLRQALRPMEEFRRLQLALNPLQAPMRQIQRVQDQLRQALGPMQEFIRFHAQLDPLRSLRRE